METDNFAKQTVAKKAIYMSCRWQFLLQVNQYLHCLFRNLNDKRPSASSDNNFVLKKINEN